MSLVTRSALALLVAGACTSQSGVRTEALSVDATTPAAGRAETHEAAAGDAGTARPAPDVAIGPRGAPAPCSIFPADNPWNTDVSDLPPREDSDTLIDSIGRGGHLHADFGTVWEGAPIGVPWVEVGAGQPRVPVTFETAT